MSDEDLIGYLFGLLDPDDRAAVAARAETDPEVAARLEKLRLAAAPLLAAAEVERDDPPAPRPGLAVRAVAKVAQHVVEHEPRVPEPANTEPAVAAFLRDYASDGPVEFDFESGTRAKVPGAAPRRRPATARTRRPAAGSAPT